MRTIMRKWKYLNCVIGVEQHNTEESEHLLSNFFVPSCQVRQDLHHRLLGVVEILDLVDVLQRSVMSDKIIILLK